MSITLPESPSLAVLRIADEMPTRDALRVIARYLDGMLNSGELRRLPQITQARVRAMRPDLTERGIQIVSDAADAMARAERERV